MLHKKTQRRILIAALIRLEYMKDAPTDQVASVNAFDGRGEGEDGTNRSDTNTALSEQPHTNPPATVATKIKIGADGTAARRDTNSNGSRNATTVENYPRRSKFPNCIWEKKGCKYTKSKGGPREGYKPRKVGSQQRQHSY